jgi:hypothetical protein
MAGYYLSRLLWALGLSAMITAQPASAAKLLPASAMVEDTELACVASLARAAQEQLKDPALVRSGFPIIVGRVPYYIAEAGNRALARYKTDTDGIMAELHARKAVIDAEYDKDVVAGAARTKADCLPLLEAAESARPAPTPGQCAAWQMSRFGGSAVRGFLTAKPDEGSVNPAPAVLNLMQAFQYRANARKALIAQGLTEAKASAQIEQDSKIARKEETLASKKKYFLVRPMEACGKLMSSFQTPKPVP